MLNIIDLLDLQSSGDEITCLLSMKLRINVVCTESIALVMTALPLGSTAAYMLGTDLRIPDLPNGSECTLVKTRLINWNTWKYPLSVVRAIKSVVVPGSLIELIDIKVAIN
eukprot:NODE_65_length_23997_cov_0.327601.p16 type:complete len:111 gc:universal NODE_65_length_23997_cov_0.327601:13521-13189(-)